MLTTQFTSPSTMRSDSGWTDNELCEIWFRKSFVLNVVARRVDDTKPIVLTYDGHESHETSAIKRLAYANDIILFCLPSKTTHKLQPLDVGMFSVLQHAWNAHSGDLAANRIVVDRYNFIPEYLATQEKVITSELIIKAFQKTGISPFNPSIFLDKDFGPSMASSSTLHLPSSYPNLIPSLPPAIPSDDEDSNNEDSDNEDSDDDFTLGCSSDVAIDSGDKNDSDDEGCGDKKDSGCIDSYDGMQSTNSTPLPNPNTLPTTHTDTQRVAHCIPPEHCPTSITPEHLGSSLPNLPPAFSTWSHLPPATPSSSMALSDIPDWKKNTGQLLAEKYNERREHSQTKAQLRAAEAHCTIMAQALADANAQLASMSKKKMRSTTKIKARFVALPELRDTFEAEEANRKELERSNAKKEAQKQADHRARQSQIMKDTVLKVFNCPFSAYKHKDELIVLAGALELDTTGTVSVLKECIKAFLDSHKNELLQNPRFVGLFQARRQHPFDREICNRELSDGAGPSGQM